MQRLFLVIARNGSDDSDAEVVIAAPLPVHIQRIKTEIGFAVSETVNSKTSENRMDGPVLLFTEQNQFIDIIASAEIFQILNYATKGSFVIPRLYF